MSWGDAFSRAYDAAGAAARAAADQAMSSARAAADAVAGQAQRAAEAGLRAAQTAKVAAVAGAIAAKDATVATATVVRDGAVVVGKGVLSAVRIAGAWGGELVNLSAGLAVTGSASMYAAAKSVLSNDVVAAPRVIARCPGTGGDIYSNDYRVTLVDSTFLGADEPRLAAAMSALQKPLPPAALEVQLQTIADLRERPLEEIRTEYLKYLEIRDAVDDRIVAKGLEEIDNLKPEQSNFMGSVWQLRYGQVVGDKLGVDPVFGALLNPTGGLVGPGNKGWAPDSALMPEAVAYHGAYHDAMGYLYNYHNEGLGYNYMQSPIGLDTGNPLAGQATGVAQWSVNIVR